MNDNSNDDGRNASDGRVYVSTQSTGSIYEIAREQGTDTGGAVIGGLHSGGLGNSEPSAESNKQYSGSPVDLGGFEARTQDGYRVTHLADLKPNDIVTINGVETELRVAIEAGLIKLNDGKLRGVTEAELARAEQQQGQQDQQQTDQRSEEQKAQADPIGPEAYKVMTDALTRDPGAVTNAAADLIEADGDMSTGAVEELASRMGVAPAEAQHRAQVAMAGYAKEAYATSAREVGVDETLAAEALQDARRSRPSEFKEIAYRHVNEGKAGYAGLVREYVAGLATTAPQQVLNATTTSGVKVFQAPNGDIMVDIPGDGQMRYEDAVHLGRITVKRNG
jgi:hypothetical protein